MVERGPGGEDSATRPSATATCTALSPSRARTPNFVPRTSVTALPACTRNGRLWSWATSKYASPSKYTSRVRRPKLAGISRRVSVLRVTLLESGSVRVARCARAVAYVHIGAR